jgi:hypothetical protein
MEFTVENRVQKLDLLHLVHGNTFHAFLAKQIEIVLGGDQGNGIDSWTVAYLHAHDGTGDPGARLVLRGL